MEPQQVKAEPKASVNVFWVLVMIALAFGSGYMAHQSFGVTGFGANSTAHVWLLGGAISLILLVLAFSVTGRLARLVRPSR
jgi:hypothetical protein